jgi:histidinol phosphatase-like PHP family hydrolase
MSFCAGRGGNTMKIMDLHSHTYWSDCGKDAPTAVIDTAIAGGIELLGITDHNYGRNPLKGIYEIKQIYAREIHGLKEHYKNKIKILSGIEVSTNPQYFNMTPRDYELFDYCLIEHAGESFAYAGLGKLFDFADTIKIPKGLAHTDLFKAAEQSGLGAEKYCRKMAEHSIFWELNINYDSIHNYFEHPYVTEFFENEKQQEVIRKAGVYISIGFDGHNIDDYLPERIKSFNYKLERLGLNTADKLFE